MHLRNYERPEGYEDGHPEVLVTSHVIEEIGMPVVDYDSLHQFLTDDLAIPYEERTTIKLAGEYGGFPILGYHLPYTRTVHVNAIASENMKWDSGGTMRILAHEGRHRSDSTNRKGLTAAEVGARWATYKVGIDVAQLIPFMGPFAVFAGIKTRSMYYKHEPAEKRARRQEVHGSTFDHETDIIFPYTKRVWLLAGQERLTREKIRQLGGSVISQNVLGNDTPYEEKFDGFFPLS